MVPQYIASVDRLLQTPAAKIAKEGLAARLMQGQVWGREGEGLTVSR
jgi:hypothetical protein